MRYTKSGYTIFMILAAALCCICMAIDLKEDLMTPISVLYGRKIHENPMLSIVVDTKDYNVDLRRVERAMVPDFTQVGKFIIYQSNHFDNFEQRRYLDVAFQIGLTALQSRAANKPTTWTPLRR